MQEVYGIAAFRSRQQVLMLESALRRQGLSVGVITTPRDVALGCGCVRCGFRCRTWKRFAGRWRHSGPPIWWAFIR